MKSAPSGVTAGRAIGRTTHQKVRNGPGAVEPGGFLHLDRNADEELP